MKTATQMLARAVCVTTLMLLGSRTPGQAEEKSDDSKAAQQDLGYDIFDGQTNRIVRVSNVTPTHVFLAYEGTRLKGRTVARQDLPPQLRERYPFDVRKAAEMERQQIALAAQRADARRAAWKNALQRREMEIAAELQSLQQRDEALQKEVIILKSLPPGNGRRVRLAYIRNEQQSIRERTVQLRTLQEQVRAQRDSIP